MSSAEEGLVAADADLEEQVGERRRRLTMPLRGLRVLEPLQARLGQRVDRDDLRAARLGLLQGGEHARVVGARVLPGDDDQVGLVEVLQQDAALADADGLGQSAEPEDSWHMLEQSGRLLVPNSRAKSW